WGRVYAGGVQENMTATDQGVLIPLRLLTEREHPEEDM
ncbi:hypothetical protein Trydic_g18510, partial [Trypoxylus dichotomus]